MSSPFLKSILPPLLWNIGKDLKRRLLRSVDHYAYAPRGWDTPLPAGASSQDYWTAFIARERSACEALIARVRNGEPIATAAGDNVKLAAFGYVLALAAHQKSKITVLDYGGNLGDYLWHGRALMPALELEYHCKELPRIAEAGRQINPGITWHTDDACLRRQYDLVMFSSSLEYLPEGEDVLVRAADAARGYLFLSDVPTVRNVPAFVATERSGGVTNLHWQLNRDEVVRTVEGRGLRLVREFAMGPYPPVANAPEQPSCAGWLFERA